MTRNPEVTQTLEVYEVRPKNKHRRAMFRVTSSIREDGTWNINMIADYVPSQNITEHPTDPMPVMLDMLTQWREDTAA